MSPFFKKKEPSANHIQMFRFRPKMSLLLRPRAKSELTELLNQQGRIKIYCFAVIQRFNEAKQPLADLDFCYVRLRPAQPSGYVRLPKIASQSGLFQKLS